MEKATVIPDLEPALSTAVGGGSGPWRFMTCVFATLSTMIMLTGIQEPLGVSWLAWFCLIPWVLALHKARKTFHILLISYLLGVVYFLSNLYWLIWVTWPGWVGLCVYLGVYFALSGFVLRKLSDKSRVPFTLTLPVLWVAQEYLRSVVMTGFGWLFLGHSQYQNLHLIQVCDVTGVYGVTFLIGMVNGLLCDLILLWLTGKPRKRSTESNSRVLAGGPLVLLTSSFLLASLFYGVYRMKQGNSTISKGPLICLVQDCIPQQVKMSGQSDAEIMARHVYLSRQGLDQEARPELIVWPETMVASPLNSEFLQLEPEELQLYYRHLLQKAAPDLNPYTWASYRLSQARQYDGLLSELAQEASAGLLVGASGLVLEAGAYTADRYNSAYLYLADGSRWPNRYDKMHLVPFGEVVPFKKSIPPLYRLLNRLTPYDYDYSLTAGERPERFQITNRDGQTYRFGVAICYEDATAEISRLLTGTKGSSKEIDFLLNISNDGWFVYTNQDKQIRPSSELLQHLSICTFRAVENRIGIARAVNTGVSAFIRPDGQIQQEPQASSLSNDPRWRQAAVGFLTDNLYIDQRCSFYSEHGDLFALGCSLLTVLLIMIVLIKKTPSATAGKSAKR